jgi:hypothetical protein
VFHGTVIVGGVGSVKGWGAGTKARRHGGVGKLEFRGSNDESMMKWE